MPGKPATSLPNRWRCCIAASRRLVVTPPSCRVSISGFVASTRYRPWVSGPLPLRTQPRWTMARAEPERTFQQTVLDRLLDDDPGTVAERPASRSDSLNQLKSAVRRDLEWLLNTRRTLDLAPDGMPELSASLHHYGLPDLSSMSRDSPEVHGQLARLVEDAVSAFEPRLTDVRVTAVPEDQRKFGELRFVIDALLQLEPTPERITFDTKLEMGKG